MKFFLQLAGSLFSLYFFFFIIPSHTIVSGYYGYMLDVCVPVRPSACLPFVCPSIFPFPMITCKKPRIFTKLGMCTDIAELWFGIANEQIIKI